MATNNSNGTHSTKKELLLNAFVMNTPGHLSPGQWRHPRNKTADYNKLSFWTSLAKLVDDASNVGVADVFGTAVLERGDALHGQDSGCVALVVLCILICFSAAGHLRAPAARPCRDRLRAAVGVRQVHAHDGRQLRREAVEPGSRVGERMPVFWSAKKGA